MSRHLLPTSKVTVACYDFTGCEGCQLAKINLEDAIVPLTNQFIEFVNFREAMDPISDQSTIAFIEGSISTPSGVRRIRRIRANCDLLITVGNCATHGGLQAMRNDQSLEQTRAEVYQQSASAAQLESLPWSLPVSAVVAVDFEIPGCPLDNQEFLGIVQQLLLGLPPKLPDHAVCVECKLSENECVYERGFVCMGQVTRAGCRARCPSRGSPCLGCRGLLSDANIEAQKAVMQQAGMSPQEVEARFDWFCSYRKLEIQAPEIATVLAKII